MLERFRPVADTNPETILKVHDLLSDAHGAERAQGITPRQARKHLVVTGNEAEYYLGATETEDVAVMALYYQHREASYIEALAVDPQHRNQRLGARALGELIDFSHADGSSLVRVVALPSSVGFYARAGFEVIGDDDSHIDMIKTL
jgi:ribosomal protein S18 acetylase RimI-like enzyme